MRTQAADRSPSIDSSLCSVLPHFHRVRADHRRGAGQYGRVGWGEGHISPGSSRETRKGGWAFCSTAVVDKDTKEAKSIAGEFNGFLKPKARLFAEPLRFAAGELVLAAGYTPTIDADVLATHELGPRAIFVAREALKPAPAKPPGAPPP